MTMRSPTSALPRIIQGGMGIGVSNWRLARAVSRTGQLGVVSGTAIDALLARRLQDGDPEGNLRRALAAFPIPDVADKVLASYFRAEGKPDGEPYWSKPIVGPVRSRSATELVVVANFVEVFLAKEDHEGLVGINYLHKIEAPLLPSIYGAMLAGVDAVIVGAGVPLAIPEIIDRLARGEPVENRLSVAGASPGSDHKTTFDPAELFGSSPPELGRPLFFPIISSALLARTLVTRSSGTVDGLIVEGASAGGHNAPPRGKLKLDERGEPIYGERDEIDLDAIAAMGLPYWLAGSQGTPEALEAALTRGASGVQLGTLFAFCAESGLRDEFKSLVVERAREGTLRVFTDPVASPTGFPFKVLALEGTTSDDAVYRNRVRICDLGYLREYYEKPDGSLGARCSAEPVEDWVRKGRPAEDAAGRKCLCNCLAANVGQAQLRADQVAEPPMLTVGDDLSALAGFTSGYTAADVVDFMLRRGG
jgi:nitronate monooxygenase